MKKLFIFSILSSLLTNFSYCMQNRLPTDEQYVNELYNKGHMLFNNKKYDEAFEQITLAALYNHADANAILGVMYFYGYGCTQDIDEALRYLEIGEQNGSAAAIANIGYLHHYGHGYKKDFSMAKTYYEKAFNMGCQKALLNLGDLYYDGDDVPDYYMALHYYTKAEKLGFPQAMERLGHMYYNGYGCEKNPKLAKEYYEKALDMGCKLALRGLGDLYYHGEYKTPNLQKAFFYYEEAERLGDPVSTLNIADAYYNGEYTYPKNKEISFYYYKRSADLGNETAMTTTGDMLIKGDGCHVNYKEGITYLNKAIAAGEKTYAPRIAGLLFYRDAIYENALNYFQIAIDSNTDDGKCAYYAALCYRYMGGYLKFVIPYLKKALNGQNAKYSKMARDILVNDYELKID